MDIIMDIDRVRTNCASSLIRRSDCQSARCQVFSAGEEIDPAQRWMAEIDAEQRRRFGYPRGSSEEANVGLDLPFFASCGILSMPCYSHSLSA